MAQPNRKHGTAYLYQGFIQDFILRGGGAYSTHEILIDTHYTLILYNRESEVLVQLVQ